MILRSYMCEDCGHLLEVELRSDQWDAEPPMCPHCAARTHQEFKAPAIGGSVRSRATDMALDIAHNDYNVADISEARSEQGSVPKVRYRDASADEQRSSWGTAAPAALAQAVQLGRQTRLQYGNGLDVIKTMPDLIQLSKARSAKVW